MTGSTAAPAATWSAGPGTRSRCASTSRPSEARPTGDDVTGFEDVEGGDQDDVLIGDDGPNKLDGGFGSDVVEGAGGADVLFGGFGGDRLDGGAGADFLSAGDEVDRVTGGAGADRLRTQGDYRADRVTCDADDRGIADRGDRGLRRCERVKRRRVAALVESSDHRGRSRALGGRLRGGGARLRRHHAHPRPRRRPLGTPRAPPLLGQGARAGHAPANGPGRASAPRAGAAGARQPAPWARGAHDPRARHSAALA